MFGFPRNGPETTIFSKPLILVSYGNVKPLTLNQRVVSSHQRGATFALSLSHVPKSESSEVAPQIFWRRRFCPSLSFSIGYET